MLHELQTKIVNSYLNKELNAVEKDVGLFFVGFLTKIDVQAKMTFDEIYDGTINQIKSYRDSLGGVSNYSIEEMINDLIYELGEDK